MMWRQARPKTIVSLTPMKIQTDSRTFKQAAAVARFGYRSIVIEARESRFPEGALPFELYAVTLDPAASPDATGTPAGDSSPTDEEITAASVGPKARPLGSKLPTATKATRRALSTVRR